MTRRTKSKRIDTVFYEDKLVKPPTTVAATSPPITIAETEKVIFLR